MRLHKLFIKWSQMTSIFIEIFDVKVLNAIYPHSIYQANTVFRQKTLRLLDFSCFFLTQQQKILHETGERSIIHLKLVSFY